MHVPPFSTHDRALRLGVEPVDGGVDVAVVAPHATLVELCVLDAATGTERRFPLTRYDWGAWSGFAPGVQAGDHYGFRVHGPWEPAAGHRYNPAKLLLDPYARGIVGTLVEDPATRSHVVNRVVEAIDDADPDGAGHAMLEGDPFGPPDGRDSAPFVPHSVIVAPPTPAPGTRNRPMVPWRDTILYEAHVKGLTIGRTDLPEELRGTYAGLAHPVMIDYFKELGITSLELLPIHAHASEPHLAALGLSNYWGYNTIGFFAPHPGYATAAARAAGPQAVLDEVRTMVATLHEAGIEVILDVVYNHTAEGGEGGPTLSWRGLDNRMFYLHDDGSPQRYADVTGTGNTLDFRRPWIIQMALDSLRYWVNSVGVDGFRFDLAVTLGRGPEGFSTFHPFLVALQTDPTLQSVKLIAEPWDVGPGGWRTGQFPAPFAEWNDRFRDAARQFWLADAASASRGGATQGVRELATRLAGSADLFGHSDPALMRGPVASINYVTAHDGFTMADLVTYDRKHNAANGEDNRDGSDNNRSWNHGLEGPVLDSQLGPELQALRLRSVRNLLGTLILAAGTPMLTAGDEIGRTQRGNNNAYCQDNEISWVDWNLHPFQEDLHATVRHLLAIRRTYGTLRLDTFFLGAPRPWDDAHQPDLTWFDLDGNQMDSGRWHDPATVTMQMLRRGVGDDAHILVVLHGGLEPIQVRLAGRDNTERDWDLLWESSWERPDDRWDLYSTTSTGSLPTGSTVDVEPLTMQVYVARLPSREMRPLIEQRDVPEPPQLPGVFE